MKKLLAILLAVIWSLLIGFSAAEEGAEIPERTVPWPEETFEGTDASLRSLKDSSQRHQSYFGPDASYHGNGAYKPAKAYNLKALFREGDYTLVDMEYPGQGRRVLYFKTSAVTGGEAETVATGDAEGDGAACFFIARETPAAASMRRMMISANIRCRFMICLAAKL